MSIAVIHPARVGEHSGIHPDSRQSRLIASPM
jgi:hypothetical protein